MLELSRQSLTKEAQAFHTKKRLGQNFLVDPDALKAMMEVADVHPGDTVLEIGPGLGFLTRYLIDAGAHVTAVELDHECVENLRRLKLNNLTLIHGDFLDFDLATIGGAFKIIANVPYQITTPILARIMGEIAAPKPWFGAVEKIVLTVQYEVAERFVATPGNKEYSQITLLTNYFCQPRIAHKVPRECFYPQPDVTSAVVEFIPLKEPPITCVNPKLLRQVIKAGFSQRRKMLKNNLAFTRASADELMQIFQKLNLDPQTRAERMTLEQFARLADALQERKEGSGQ